MKLKKNVFMNELFSILMKIFFSDESHNNYHHKFNI